MTVVTRQDARAGGRFRPGRGLAVASAVLAAAFAFGCGERAPPPALPSPGKPEVAAEASAAAGGPPGGGAAAVRGRIVYRGALPESTTVYVPEAGTIEVHTIIVDPATRGLKDAVVWIDGLPRGRRPAAPQTPPPVLDQRRWTFVPHVLAVRAGEEVRFLNSDIANHNIHTRSPGLEFNLGSPSGVALHHTFRRPSGSAPIRVECDIHDWMLAWIYVFDHGCFAVTDAQGQFEIRDVPSGRWRLRVHHADGGLERATDLSVGSEDLVLEVEALRPEAQAEEGRAQR